MNTLRQRVPFFMNYASGYLDTVTGTDIITLPKAKLNSLKYVKLFGGTEQRNLPSEYTQVEYLESSGTQYIDTGIVLKSKATVTTVGQSVQGSTTSGPYSFWGFMGSDTLPRWGWSIFSNRWLPDLNTTSQYAGTADTNKHTFINTCYYENNVLQYDSLLDGNSVSVGRVESLATYTSNSLSAYLFARNTGGTAGNFLACRIFSYEIVQDDVLVINLIPARRKSDNVLGMYDTVTSTFLTNAGTGTFTAGADVTPSPDTPMDIVSNNGVLKARINLVNTANSTKGQYINNQGIIQSSANWATSDYLPVIAGGKVTVSGLTYASSAAGFNYYDASKNKVSTIPYETGTHTYTVPNDASYIMITYRWLDDESTVKVYVGETLNAPYADGTTETVQITGKNLYNPATRTDGYYIGADGVIAKGSGTFCYSALIPVKPNTDYMLSGIACQSGQRRLHAYDSNGDWISQISFADITTGNTYNVTGTMPNNCVYVRISIPMLDTNVQLELGSTATTYEPYFNGGSATAENLFKIGTYQDVQSVIDGSVTRQIGITILDGTEDWKYASSSQFFYTDISNLNALESTHTCYCTHFQGKSTDETITSGSNQCKVGWNIGSSIVWNRVYISPNISLYANVNAIKQYLADQYNAGTPVIVVYPLATATTETVTGQPLTTKAGTNYATITQASLDNLELEVKYKRSR